MKIILSRTTINEKDGWNLEYEGGANDGVQEFYEDDLEALFGMRVKEFIENELEVVFKSKYSNGEPIIAILGLEDTVDILDQSNLQDIFGRCLGEQTTFERIDGVFTELWDSRRVLTFDAVSKMMGA